MLDNFAAHEPENVKKCPVVFTLFNLGIDHGEIALTDEMVNLDIPAFHPRNIDAR